MNTTMPNKFIKVSAVLFSLLLFACSSKENKKETVEQVEVKADEKMHETNEVTTTEKSFEETQDSLRKVLLSFKPKENLKSSLLQEFYIRGLVNQKGDSIYFVLPFNLHGLDCGAPDCYSTDITFKIPSNEPIEFPDKIDFTLYEHGCIDIEKTKNSVFKLKENSVGYVNYFSEELKSNLIIKKNGELYYYPHLKTNSINVKTVNKMFENNEFEDAEIAPFQSTVMTSNEYEHFIKK